MYRGTTPTLKITVKNVELRNVEDVWITFKNQGSNVIALNKTIDDLIIDEEENVIKCKFSQEDALKIHNRVRVQLKIYLKDSNVCASKIFGIDVDEILNTDVMGGEADE